MVELSTLVQQLEALVDGFSAPCTSQQADTLLREAVAYQGAVTAVLKNGFTSAAPSQRSPLDSPQAAARMAR